MIDLGRVGIWTRQLDTQAGSAAQDAVAELESLGYRTVWIPEAVEREVVSHATLLLSGTSSIVVASGVARVHARSPRAAALAQRLLAERFPNRFLLGLGVSHPLIVERVLGQEYRSPLATMRDYLDAIDDVLAGPLATPTPAEAHRILAALGPKMLGLAAERSLGAHTYLAPVAHTAWARDALGPGPVLAPAIKAVLDTDAERARARGRHAVAPSVRMPAYRENLLRSGFETDDLDGQLSDRLVDALVAWGDAEAVACRVREHLDAGADHVCVELLTGDDVTVPMEGWQELAAPLLAI